MRDNQNRPIGIIGGMGAEASLRLVERIIELSRQEFRAKDNDEFPEIVMVSIPVPDFIDSKRRVKEAREIIMDRIKKIEKMNLSCLGIACNTAHVILETEKNLV